jgi:hypothetical protein
MSFNVVSLVSMLVSLKKSVGEGEFSVAVQFLFNMTSDISYHHSVGFLLYLTSQTLHTHKMNGPPTWP